MGRLITVLACVCAALAASEEPALAHMVSADVGDFYAGLLHPLTSLEHFLPLAGLAFLAAQSGTGGGRLAVLVLPLALAAGVCGGALWPLPHTAAALAGLGLAASGILAACCSGLPPGLVGLCAAVVGTALGWRGGADWAVSRAGWQFVPGEAACGFLVVALGAAWLPRLGGGRPGLVRAVVGLGLAVAGAWLAGRGALGEAGATAGLAAGAGWLDGSSLQAFLEHPTASPWALAGVLAGAMAWGGAHALTPGHGKALVGAYLVGARGNWRHAVWLGLTVAATHTAGVFVLGGAAVLAAGHIPRERLLPWLALASGLGMCGVGGAMAVRGVLRLRADGDYAHGHSHGGSPQAHGRHILELERKGLTDAGTAHSHGGIAHSHGGIVHSHGGAASGDLGWRSLVALGVAGGLVPCPSALALMLGAIALGRPGWGLVLAGAFGLGLAGVLTAVGLLCLAGVRRLDAAGRLGRAAGWLPLVGAGCIAAIGMLAVIEALAMLFP
jgi:ABC-type nickel/cobalt efflux system permease component RcnA